MGKLQWGPELETGIATIDSEHKQLVSMFNDLLGAMSSGKSRATCTAIVGELKEYAARHFATEEKLFAAYDYPGTSEHVAEHEKFVEKAREFDEECASGKKFMSMSVARFMSDWLVNHIKGMDMKYAPFLKGKGVN